MRSQYLVLVVLIVCAPGCKTEEAAADTDVTTVVDHVYAERGLLSILPLMNALRAGPGTWSAIPTHTCATVDSITGDTAAFPLNGPVAIYLRYPDPGCVDVDGRTRLGQVRLFLNGVMTDPTSVVQISSTDLTVDGKRHRFGMRDSTAADTSLIVRMDSSFMFRQGDWSRAFEGSLTYIQTEGESDALHSNDAYRIMVDVNGQDHNGLAYSAITTSDLHLSISCRWVTSGSETITPEDRSDRVLDYGSGGCDASTAITVENEVIGLTIP